MKKKPCIVTITDGISPTSMPFNEFILFRLRHYPHEKQVLIQVFEKGIVGDVHIPDDVDYYSLGINPFSLNKVIKKLEKKYDVVAYHIHEGKSVILFSISTLLCKRNKSIYTIHSTYKNYPFHNKLFCFCGSLLAGSVVCVSKTSFRYFPTVLKKVRKRHVIFIQNGVDMERIDAVTAGIDNNGVFTAVYVARFDAMKRHDMLLDIVNDIPSIKLKLIGEGPLESELKDRTERMGISERVFFTGLLTREQVYSELKSANLFVSTSSYEGLPIGVLEAMGCGTLCLVSDIEQHAEIAEKCPTLQLCPDDINQWIKGIQSQMNLSKSDIEDIKMRNKQSVSKFFSLVTMHKHYNELYFQHES